MLKLLKYYLFTIAFFALISPAYPQAPNDPARVLVESLILRDSLNLGVHAGNQSIEVVRRQTLLIEEALEELTLAKDSATLVRYHRALAILFENYGNDSKSLHHYTKAMSFAGGHSRKFNAGRVTLRLAELNLRRAFYDLSLEQFMEGLDASEIARDTVGLARAYLGISRIYLTFEDTATASALIRRSEELIRRLHANSVDWKITVALAELYFGVGDLHGVTSAMARLEDICNRYCDPEARRTGRLLSGRMRLEINDVDSASAIFTTLIVPADERANYTVVLSNFYLAKVRLKQSSIESAIELLKKCEKLCQENEFNEVLLKTYDLFVQIYKGTRDLNSLAHYQNLYIHQKHKVYGEKVLVKLSSLQAEFGTREESKILDSQAELMRINEELIRKEQSINIGIAIAAIMLVMVLRILYVLNHRKKIFNRNLDKIVQERTRELEEKQVELQKSLNEMSLEFVNLQHQLRMKLRTLEGIYYISRKDKSKPEDQKRLAELEKMICEIKEQIASLSEFTNGGSVVGWNEETGNFGNDTQKKF